MDWKDEYRNVLLDIASNSYDVRKIIEQHIPSKLYKYGSFQNQYWKKVIYKAQIYLSPANIFNDPFDCRANFNYYEVIRSGKFREELLKRYSKDDLENIPEEMVQQNIIEGMREDIYVFCFSEIWNSVLMWAHYANNYNGYCIEYDMSEVKNYIIDKLFPVLYQKEYIDITLYLKNNNEKAGLICNLVKALDWNYEREWRIVDYFQHPIYFKRALKAIYLGKNCSKDIQQEILQWSRENNKKVYFVHASESQYKLEAYEVK